MDIPLKNSGISGVSGEPALMAIDAKRNTGVTLDTQAVTLAGHVGVTPTSPKAATLRFPFNRTTLAALTVPAGKPEVWCFDTKTHGLGYRRTAAGVGAFYIFRRVKKRPAKIRLGGDEITVEQARSMAAEVNADIARGIDPRDKRRQLRADTVTLGELVTHYINVHCKPHRKSWEDEETMADTYLGEYKSRRLSSITREDIRALHAKIGTDKGKYAANRLLSLLHASYANAGDLWTGDNPARAKSKTFKAGVQKFEEQARDRYLSTDELPRFFKSLLIEENETIRDYLLILLLVGQRRSNTSAMQWSEIDLVRGVWRIGENKSGKPVVVPLAPQAIQILLHRQKTSTSNWVFPTATDKKKSASGHIEQFRASWNRILKRAEIADLRLHDLRRSLGSWLANNGTSLQIIGAVLGHRSTASTAVYARLSVAPQSVAVNNVTAEMFTHAPKGLLPVAAKAKSKRSKSK